MSAQSSDSPALDAELEPGTVVGEYEVESKLGQGAFGKVYKGLHPLIGKVVAIKVLGLRFSVDPEMVSRFVAEARAVNQIRHRHIIDIFSFGKLPDGRQYYVMEYLDGEPLDARLERSGRLHVAEAIHILRGVAKALDAAHAKGIAHRDLKAENVFLAADSDGGVFPKLLDFGIAKLLANDDGLKHKTRTGVSIGTPFYMSPEQSRGRDVDHRTDIYAFGVLAYVVLTGKFPFDGDDYMSILMKHVTVDADPPSTHVPELPKEIDDIVLWLMAKEASDRPQNLRVAMRALEEAAGRAGLVTMPPPSAIETGPVPAVPMPAIARKKRWPMFAAIGGLVVAASAATFAMTRGGHDEPAPAPAPAPAVAIVPPPKVEAPPPPPPPKVEAPASVTLTIEGVPEGTEVILAGKTIAAAPGAVQLDKIDEPVLLTFRADGYITSSKKILLDRDQTVDVGLKKKPVARRSNKDDIIDVFGGKK